jgi:hypothetical protein
MSNLSKKIDLEKLMYLARYLLDVQLEHGVSTAHETRTQDIKYFMTMHGPSWYNFDAQELAWLEEVAEKAVQHIIVNGKNSFLSHHIMYAYDNEPPDTRTPEQIREDRLKEYTQEQIEEFGLDAFEIMIDSDYAGKYTFDMIWNGDIGPDTAYEGMDEDPIHDLMHKNIDARVALARNWKLVEELKGIVEGALNNDPQVFGDPDRAWEILTELDKEEES